MGIAPIASQTGPRVDMYIDPLGLEHPGVLAQDRDNNTHEFMIQLATDRRHEGRLQMAHTNTQRPTGFFDGLLSSANEAFTAAPALDDLPRRSRGIPHRLVT